MIALSHQEQSHCWAAEGIAYCSRPCAPEVQRLSIYIPDRYLDFKGETDGAAEFGTVHGATYSASTVPVVLYNDIGGYAECAPAHLTSRNRRYLEDGYVVVSVGARGRQSRDGMGRACGKAPAGLVDLKAAVRWLRAHADELPAGNVEQIVSVGTSAGGAMSSLLAVTGNVAEYLPYLEAIGAELDQRDDVFAAQCYCPIIDLDHADMAYEWMYRSKRIYTFGPRALPQVLDDKQLAVGKELADNYPSYVNSLGLLVDLGEDGRSGSYYRALMAEISNALNEFLERRASTDEARHALAEELDAGAGYIVWSDGRARIDDLDAYVRSYVGRMKGCPAFDPFDGSAPENQEFGAYGATEGATNDSLHYSATTAQVISRVADRMKAFGLEDLAASYAQDCALDGQAEKTRLINPMAMLAAAQGNSDIASHVRIRVGSRDADHSFSAGFNLYQALRARGVDVDYGLIWGRGHCDADYPGEFSAWVDMIAK